MFCENCGSDQKSIVSWPHTCKTCGRTKYKNPIPVAVALIQSDDGGLVLIKRKGGVASGLWAFPGGFMDINDPDYAHAASREVREETGLEIPEASWRLYQVLSPPSKDTLILFVVSSHLINPSLIKSVPINNETEDIRVVYEDEVESGLKLAFDLHTQVMQNYFLPISPTSSESSNWVG